MTVTTIPLWCLLIFGLLALGWASLRPRYVPQCGEPIPSGGPISCNKKRGHDGHHMHYWPGTGVGDDRLFRWEEAR